MFKEFVVLVRNDSHKLDSLQDSSFSSLRNVSFSAFSPFASFIPSKARNSISALYDVFLNQNKSIPNYVYESFLVFVGRP